MHDEIRALRLAHAERQVGGVYFEGTLQDAWRANLWLRTAVRVLMRLSRFDCPDDRVLYDAVREVDWSRFLLPTGKLVVDARTSASRLDHSRFIEQRVKDAVVDQFRERTGGRPSVDRDEADLGIYVHLSRDRCSLLVDTSGRALHRRGWRRSQGPAPLAETLAAAMLSLGGWDRRSPLLDPFCGSGTIPIEAALLASRTAPGLFRSGFGFERWPGHDRTGWESAREAARAEVRATPKLRLIGSDSDPERVAEARANAESAGVAERIEWSVADARDFAPRPGWNGWVVSNLPYGRRVAAGDLDALYRDFGAVLRERCAGYHTALLCAKGPRIGALGLPRPREHALVNGGLDCRVVCTRLDG